MGYLDGFGVIIKKWAGVNTPSGARVTVEYPEEVRPKPERFHGRHVLNRYEDGMEKCIGCELCAGVCPAKCIYVRGADNDPENPTSPGERFGYVYEINYLRCIHCDLCVEACPTEAITETKLFEFSFTNRSDAIYTKKELVVGDDGRPQQLPWENWDGGFDPAQDTSGWMRATSPGGDADFKGIVAWAGELGYGVRPPERASVLEEVGAVPAGSPIHVHALDHVEPVEQTEPVGSTSGVFDAGDLDLTQTKGAAVRSASLSVADTESVADDDSIAEARGNFDIDSEPAVPSDFGDTAEGGRRSGEFDAPEGLAGSKRKGSADAGFLDEDLSQSDIGEVQGPGDDDPTPADVEADGADSGDPTDRTGFFDAPEGAVGHVNPASPPTEEVSDDDDDPAEEVQESVDGSELGDAENPAESEESQFRMGYFDAPEEDSAEKNKKKRRFFK